MKVRFEKVPRPFPLGFVFGLASTVALAGFYFVMSMSPGFGVECAFKKWTGYPCPTCGGTRAVSALARGRLGEALAWNPLVFAGLLALAAWALLSLCVEVVGRREMEVELTRLEKWLARALALLLVLGGWAYLFLHAERF